MSETEHIQRLLVTGASGFVGHHLLGAVRSGLFGNVELLTTPEGFDIRDSRAVKEFVSASAPEFVLHLAAQSFVPRSFEDPRETLEINLLGTLNLLQALDGAGFTGRMLYISSGDVYGRVPDSDLPVDESRVPEPRNPYAVSKFAAEQLCLQWHRSHKLDVIIARPFNHIGPGQRDDFVIPSIAKQIVAMKCSGPPFILEVGDIDVSRDMTDVRDIVAAYAALLKSGQAGAVYVVASGVESSIRELLRIMCEAEGVDPEIRQDPARLRPAEQGRMVANHALLTETTGWTPSIPIRKTLEDILEYARNTK